MEDDNYFVLVWLVNRLVMKWNENKEAKSEKKGKRGKRGNKSIFTYSETLNNEYIERIHQMSYSLLSDNGMLEIFSFLIKWLYGTL